MIYLMNDKNYASALRTQSESLIQKLSNWTTFHIFVLRIKNGNFFFFKNYFEDFYENQSDKVKKKIVWTLRVIEEIDQIPEIYLKHLSDTTGLYEIRIQVGNNIYRIFCFFDLGNIIVVGHGFHKKTQKTPKQQIERAEQIKKEYYESKK